MERRFQPVFVGEPSIEETKKILQGLRDKYEAYHKVKIADDALDAAAELSAKFINDRFLPDKAIDLIDEAASKKRIDIQSVPPEIKDMELELQKMAQKGWQQSRLRIRKSCCFEIKPKRFVFAIKKLGISGFKKNK